MLNSTVRNDVKKLVANIENLARDVQSKLDADADFLATTHELVRNSVTLTFTLGEFYALEQAASAKKVKAPRNYHNYRINGKFARKV